MLVPVSTFGENMPTATTPYFSPVLPFAGGGTAVNNISIPQVPSPQPETIGGVGSLVWLNSTSGLISSQGVGLVVFEIKDFCDQAVIDLTSVLRVGYVLKFQALCNHQPSAQQSNIRWCASFIAPLLAQDFRLASPGALQTMVHTLTANLDSCNELPYSEDPSRKSENYKLDMELRALPFLLTRFQQQNQARLPLNTVHTYISNCGQDDLYQYIGKSSIKRRQFLERRTHTFEFRGNTVCLVPPGLHVTVLVLSAHLIHRGGSMPLQELFDFFIGCPEIPIEARDLIGDGKNKFLQFLDAHPWIFAVFPSRVFVSIRRKLVDFKYPQLCQEGAIDQDIWAIMGTGVGYSGSLDGVVAPQENGSSMFMPAAMAAAAAAAGVVNGHHAPPVNTPFGNGPARLMEGSSLSNQAMTNGALQLDVTPKFLMSNGFGSPNKVLTPRQRFAMHANSFDPMAGFPSFGLGNNFGPIARPANAASSTTPNCSLPNSQRTSPVPLPPLGHGILSVVAPKRDTSCQTDEYCHTSEKGSSSMVTRGDGVTIATQTDPPATITIHCQTTIDDDLEEAETELLAEEVGKFCLD